MAFDSFAAFVAMGGDGFFVWMAYGISLAGMAGYFALLWRQRRRLKRHIKRLAIRDQQLAGHTE